jgi:DNA-binding beta-propeller fold protein YncE
MATAVLLGGGCTNRDRTPASAADSTKLVWPPPPDAPRIRYVQSITRPLDVGVKPSGPARVWRWIVGNNPEKEFLSKPFGVAVDDLGNVCITDTGANTVCYFDRAKPAWRRWDKIGTLRFSSPVAVVKRGGVFYVADTGLERVIAFDESGKLLFQITERLERPAGLAFAGDRLLVVDSKRHAVLSFDASGKFLSEFGRRGTAPGDFNFPTHIAAGPAGNLFVTDSMNSRVQMLSPEGKFLAQIGSIGDSPGQFSRPKGVAVDPQGHVYVVDALFDNIQVFDREGRFLLTMGGSGQLPGQFWLANGIAVSAQNEIFVADAYNKRIQVFQYVGQQ